MSRRSHGIEIWPHSAQAVILQHSHVSAEKDNPGISRGDIIQYDKRNDSWIGLLILKVNKLTGETTEKGYSRYKKYYQIWQTYRNHEIDHGHKTTVDGSLLTEFPVNQPSTKKKGKRVKLR